MEITKENLKKFITNKYEMNPCDDGDKGYNMALEDLEEKFILGESEQ